MTRPARTEQPGLLIVQPYLTAYRLPVFAALATRFEGTLLASSPPPAGSGYGEPDTAGTAIRRHVRLPERRLLGGRLFWQQGLLALLWRERPARLLITANPRVLSTWAALLLGRAVGIACHGHGQGFYDKPAPPRWLVLAYRAMLALMHGYIAYSESSAESLRRAGVGGRLSVAENSLELDAITTPEEKTGREPGVLFLGRLREGHRLELLIEAMVLARTRTGLPLELHVVGDGAARPALQTRYADIPWLHWHGGRYAHAEVRDIARSCRVGCYPGDAGLSVVHYMGLSLVPVIHDRLDLHMGPEPSYVVDGDNGRRFAHADGLDSLAGILAELFTSPDTGRLAERAHARYHSLNTPPLAVRMARILERGPRAGTAGTAC